MAEAKSDSPIQSASSCPLDYSRISGVDECVAFETTTSFERVSYNSKASCHLMYNECDADPLVTERMVDAVELNTARELKREFF